jgi:CheY-like chemotaxis protein
MHGATTTLAGPDRGALEREPPERRRTVLVVEDNADTAETLRMLLQFFGYEVCVALTGPEGVRQARARRPDVVLCDIGLPGLDGFGVAAALRADPATAGAHLVAVTGYGSEQTRRRCREAGFDRYFTKPVDPELLVEVVATAPAHPA